MATALDVIEGALKLLGIKPAESAIQPEEAQDGLASLNDMMNAWEDSQLYTGFVSVADVGQQLSVPDALLGAMKSSLAVYVAPEYGRVVTPILQQRQRKDIRQARAAFVQMRPAKFPDTLPTGSGNTIELSHSNGDRANLFEDTFYEENEPRNF